MWQLCCLLPAACCSLPPFCCMPPKCTLIELILSAIRAFWTAALAAACRKLLIGFNSVDRLASTGLNSLIETPCGNKCDKAPQQQEEKKKLNNVPRWMTLQLLLLLLKSWPVARRFPAATWGTANDNSNSGSSLQVNGGHLSLICVVSTFVLFFSLVFCCFSFSFAAAAAAAADSASTNPASNDRAEASSKLRFRYIRCIQGACRATDRDTHTHTRALGFVSASRFSQYALLL